MNDTAQPNQQLVDAATVGDAIGVRAATVREWAKEGRIPALRLSPRTIRFDLAEVLATLKRETTTDRGAGS